MNGWDVLILAMIAAAVAAAVIRLRKNHASGGCSCGCEGCSSACRMREEEEKEWLKKEDRTDGN